MKRLLALVAALIMLLSGCGEPTTLGFDINYGVRSFDPQLASTDSELIVIKNCFTGLFDKDENGMVINGLCDSYDISDDGLVYTFRVKKGCFWNDGETPVTANDFVFALKRLFQPATNAPSRSDFYDILNARRIANGEKEMVTLGVKLIDEYTLSITLESANPMFLDLLTTAAAMPCNEEYFESTKGRYGLSVHYVLFNGPYYVRRVNNASYVLSPNEQSIFPNDKYENIYLFVKDDPRLDAVARLRDNTVDAARLYPSDVAALEDEFTIRESENTTWVLAFNTKNEVLSSAKIRRAITYSVDKSLLDGRLEENYQIADAYVPPSVTINGKSYRRTVGRSFAGFGYDRKLAQTLLSEGMDELSMERMPTLTLICTENFVAPLGYVQKSIQDTLGIFINLSVVSEDELENAVSEGSYDIALASVTPQYDNPSAVFSIFNDKNSKTGYYSKKLVETVKSAANTYSYDEMAEIYSVAEQMLLQDMPALPMFYETSYFAVSKKISGLDYSVFGGHIVFRFCK